MLWQNNLKELSWTNTWFVSYEDCSGTQEDLSALSVRIIVSIFSAKWLSPPHTTYATLKSLFIFNLTPSPNAWSWKLTLITSLFLIYVFLPWLLVYLIIMVEVYFTVISSNKEYLREVRRTLALLQLFITLLLYLLKQELINFFCKKL